jgi:hypothetical protein
VRLALATLLGLAAAAATIPACLCATPSADVDGGDLMGVFSHDAGSDGAAASADGGRHRKHKDAGHDASPSPATSSSPASPAAPDASVRAPVEGVCVAPEGAPDREIRRIQGRPPCRGAQVVEWKDAEGSPRYACIVSPPGVETRAPLPLLVFFHDEQDDPSSVHKKTNLPKLSASYNLAGDPAHTGFIVLAPQGRHLRGGKRGSVFDSEYTGPDSVDAATVDHFIADLDARGLVDRRRVYTLGASYGAHMAATYAMMRADKVAAFAAYAADAPKATWSCGGPPPPGLVLYRACDGFISCESVERWLRAREAVSAETPWIRLGAGTEQEPSCAVRNQCTPKRAEGNHHRWPKGKEGDILAFFARHVLGAGP